MAREDIDIEQFPTSEAAKRMLSRVSPIYDTAYVGKWLFQIMGMEWDEAQQIVRSLRDQCFLERATWGLRYWEERYGIEVDETLDLETRRKRIRRAEKRYGPISPAKVEEYLKLFIGQEQSVHVTEDNAHYSFSVEFETDPSVDYETALRHLKEIKPSHLSCLAVYITRFEHSLTLHPHIGNGLTITNIPESLPTFAPETILWIVAFERWNETGGIRDLTSTGIVSWLNRDTKTIEIYPGLAEQGAHTLSSYLDGDTICIVNEGLTASEDHETHTLIITGG